MFPHVLFSFHWFRSWWRWGWGHGWLALAMFAVLHVLFAVYTLRDARTRDRLFLNAPSTLWALVVLIGGLPGVALYWLANASSFTVLPPRAAHDTQPRAPLS